MENKYLDREDIESLGFIEKEMYWYNNNIRLAISKANPLHILIERRDKDDYWNIVFDGHIKNKSELKKVLTMLSIDKI